MIYLFLFVFLFHSEALHEKEKWLVEESSTLIIEGSSNVNEFTCQVEGRMREDTLTIDYDESSGTIDFIKNEVLINTRAFDCQNSMITADLKKTLNADRYPFITLKFLSLEKPAFRNFSSQKVKGTISLNIAGKTRKYIILYQMTPRTDGTLLLKGDQLININDFNLSTPGKLMGLIKVNEEIEVNFTMKLRPLL